MNMNNNHDTLNILMEECSEIISACSKIIRFGPNDHAPNSNEDNITRLTKEIGDLLAVIELLGLNDNEMLEAKEQKLQKMKKYASEVFEKRDDTPRWKRASK